MKKTQFNHIHKKRKASLETRAEPAVLCAYVEKQAFLEPILLYRASKCKQIQTSAVGLFMNLLFSLFCDIIISFLLFRVKM